MMWRFRVGDVVSHREYNNLNGIIIDQKISSEIEPDYDDDSPWYVIRWFSFPKDEMYDTLVTTGQESEGQLNLVERFINLN